MTGIKSTLFAMFVILGGACCKAQVSTNSSVADFAFLQGDWEGQAWVSLGPNNTKVLVQKERVELKLNNNILQIDGTGIENDQIVFEALGIVSVSKEIGKYAFKAYRENGLVTDAYFYLKGDRQYEWGFDLGGGAKSRFSGRIDEKGKWNEIGEYSPDGSKWYKTFEMTLDKKN
jgi:hypothetical protein